MDQVKETIRRLYEEAISGQRSSGVRPDSINITEYTVSARPSSLEAFYRFFTEVSKAFPDYELRIENMIVKGDRVMVRYTITGTHVEHFMGQSPSHEKTVIFGIDIFRLENDRVIEHWDAAHQINVLSRTTREQSAQSRQACSSSTARNGRRLEIRV